MKGLGGVKCGEADRVCRENLEREKERIKQRQGERVGARGMKGGGSKRREERTWG